MLGVLLIAINIPVLETSTVAIENLTEPVTLNSPEATIIFKDEEKTATLRAEGLPTRDLFLLATSTQDQTAIFRVAEGSIETVMQGEVIPGSEFKMIQVVNKQVLLLNLRDRGTLLVKEGNKDTIDRIEKIGAFVEPDKITPERSLPLEQ